MGRKGQRVVILEVSPAELERLAEGAETVEAVDQFDSTLAVDLRAAHAAVVARR